MAPLRASESEPLLPLTKDDEATAQLRDRVTTQYTTIALVSALLSAVSFAAFAQPPAIFPVAGAPPTPPPLTGLQPPSPPPAPSVHHGIGGDTEWLVGVVYAFATSYGVELVLHAIMTVLWHIYGIVMPLAFVCNLAGTLAASGVILYANSTLATGPAIRRLFGTKQTEHAIIKYPAAFLVIGVGSLFVGFCIGIALYYGVGVALLSLAGALMAYWFYSKFYAHTQTSDTFNALNVSLLALFFRSCLPDVATQADNHPASAAIQAEVKDERLEKLEAAAAEAEEAEERERKRAEWDERAGAIGRAVAEQLRAEPVVVRRDPAEETRDFNNKKGGGCCK